MKSKLLIAIAVLVVLSAGWLFFMRSNGTTANKMPDQVSYNFHIRPILSDKCFKCHGPDKNKREAGLRLDIPDSAFAPLKETKGSFAFVPYKPEESEVYKRITSTDSAYFMPTPSSLFGYYTTFFGILMISKKSSGKHLFLG